MVIKRVMADIILDEKDFNEEDFTKFLSKKQTIREGEPNEEKSTITVHDCGHDGTGACRNLRELI